MVNWSYSTVNTFKQCNRKYYFSKVLASHGRSEPLRRKAYELKHMQNIAMWQGSVVDKFMEVRIIPAFKNNEELNFAELAKEVIIFAKNQFTYSEYQVYLDPTVSKGEAKDAFCILDIHELGKPYTEAEIATAYATISEAVLNMPSIRMPDGKLLIKFLKECKERLTPNINNKQVEIGNAKVKPQIDLVAYPAAFPVVIDWKVSNSEVSDYSRQLVICGFILYLKRLDETGKKPFEFKDIKLYEVNLLKGVVKEHEFTKKRVNEITDYITLTSTDMALLAQDTQLAKEIDQYEFTDDEVFCTFCNYRSLCTFLHENNNQYYEQSYLESVQNTEFSRA